jgi:serine/threonine protein kinase
MGCRIFILVFFILQAKGRGLSDWQMHIIMEYCDGGSLQDAIRQNRFYDVTAHIPHLPSVLELLSQVGYITQ